MEAKTLVPVVGLTALKAHSCNGCDHAKAVIDSHNSIWVWCPVLQCPMDKACRHATPADEDQASRLSHGFRDAPPEEVEEYLRERATSQILKALESRPESWFGEWSLKEMTYLDYPRISETLATLLEEGRVEKKEIPSGALWRVRHEIRR